MGFDLKAMGRRLREARDNLGISQEAAAAAIGVPRTAVTHIENGNRSVSTLELAQLAALYHRPVAEFFLTDSDADDPLVVLYRMLPGLEEHPEFRDKIALYVDLCREGRSLEQILGRGELPTLPDYGLPLPASTADAVQQGQRIAEKERGRLGLGDMPIPDLADLIAEQGIWASGVELPDEVSGLFLHHPSIGMTILVNVAHPRGRKRFSYAHEYAHALLDRQREVNVTTRTNRRERVEQRANAFAAAFLMPPGGVDEVLLMLNKGGPSRLDMAVFDVASDDMFEATARQPPGSQTITYRDVAMLAAHFKVSYQAAVYRLKSLGRVNADECAALLRQDALAGDYLAMLKLDFKVSGNDRDPSPDRELHSQVLHLAFEAFSRQEISKGRLLDLAGKLNVSPDELREHEQAAQRT